MSQSLEQFNAKMGRVVSELDGTAARARLKRVAMDTKKDVDEAVRGTLGDQSMSGWRRSAPIAIKGSVDIKSDSTFTVTAGKGTGPMRVLEQGRNQGNASGFSGPGVNAKTGETARTKSGAVRKVRARKGKRWNGRTRGKGTWTHAVKLMEQRVPERVDKQLVKDLGRILGKG